MAWFKCKNVAPSGGGSAHSVSDWCKSGNLQTVYNDIVAISAQDMATLMTTSASVQYITNWIKEDSMESRAVLQVLGKRFATTEGELDYLTVIFPISIPKMTSSTTPSGTVTVASVNESYQGYYAFDKSKNTFWQPYQGYWSWIKYDFGTGVKAKGIYYYNQTPNRYYHFQASNDDTNWVTLGISTTIEGEFFALDNDTSYRYYRMITSSVGGDSSWCSLREMNVYAFE